jgi:hypothetical protein
MGSVKDKAQSSAQLHFDQLPYGCGTQASWGVRNRFPFTVAVDQDGFIRQVLSDEMKSRIVGSYGADDYDHPTRPPGESDWANELAAPYLEFIRKTVVLRGKRVIEIGAGSLHMAERIVADDGAKSYLIVDPSMREESADPAVKVLRAYFDGDERFDADAIVSLNCLEHVPDPLGFAKGIRAVLSRSGGTATLIFPDNEIQLRRGDLGTFIHEHLSYWTRSTAFELFRRVGLKVVQWKTQADTFFFHVACADGPVPQAAAETDAQAALAAAQAAVKRNLELDTRRVREALDRGSRVALHGACGALNNFMALSGLEGDERIFVFDGDASKAGRYLPALPAPIRQSADPLYKTMDEVFVAALTYYEPIRNFLMKQHGIPAERIKPIFTESRGI